MEGKKSKDQSAEADKAFKEGEKAIKTGILKWSPDYLEGAMRFEKAAKLYKALGNKDKALQAFLKYSLCSEKINENFGAAEGLCEAAFLEKDRQKSFEYLHRASNFYKIQGSNNQGQHSMKKFAQKLLESDDQEAQQFALDIYQVLFEEVFEGDNLMWNPDIVPEYVSLLMKRQEYGRAIESKKQFIRHLKQQGPPDHQIRRAYLEIVCIQIVAEDQYKIEDTLQDFCDAFGDNPYTFDEFNYANTLKDAILAKDFKTIETVCKKPIFSFLDVEIVKAVKRAAINGMQNQDIGTNKTGKESKDVKKEKQKVLDNMLL